MSSGDKFEVKRFGREQEPIVIVDNFITDPQALMDKAATLNFEKKGPYYPGIRAAAEPSYLGETMAVMTEILKTIFDIQSGAKLIECNYSLVTTPQTDLRPIQRLPHYDGTDEGRIAVLHYLCGKEQGGTAFYRQRSTGFETVTGERLESYRNHLQADAAKFGLPPAQYASGDSEMFEEIGRIHAVPNRCIFYRGVTLHSGLIPKGFDFNRDPKKGRLTVNTFLSGR